MVLRTFDCHVRVLFWIVLFSTGVTIVAWKQCLNEDGGGSCPERNTCCPTEHHGISACIPAKSHDPDNALGQCCDGETGCGYGYRCAFDSNGRPYCQLESNPPGYLTNDTARYELCTVPREMQTFLAFPMGDGTLRVPYYSNMGDITSASTAHLHVEKVVIMVHGSERNADDYFCASLSLLNDPQHKNTMNSTLVIVPLYGAPGDGPLIRDMLLWADKKSASYPLSHSWRYGADAINAPISSYAVLDSMVQYLALARIQFPKLKRIAVAGHSAGGQVTHRWSLLSNIPAWNNTHEPIEIVAVVANPRSYCYLDGRRFLKDGSFNIPDTDDISICSNYNQWQWGLQEGGYLTCPYKDRAIQQISVQDMTQRYATRNVVYLSGQFDTIPANDQCETSIFQGRNRQERAKLYVQSLTNIFGHKVHQFHIIEGSPHDHSLMFQSQEGKRAILGDDGENAS